MLMTLVYIMEWIILIGLLISYVSGSDYWNSLDICHMSACAPYVVNATVLEEFCGEDPVDFTTYMDGRCCMNHHSLESNDENTIVGLDLSMCALQTLAGLSDPENNPLVRSRLQMLVANENPLENCSAEYFSGMSGLQYLSLPSDCGCPGGETAWLNISTFNNTIVCSGLKNICKVSNTTCPENSHCELHSPGFTWCVCDKGYYGYKCLRSGSFHSEMFGFLLAGGTVFMSGVFWFLLRKHVVDMETKETKSQ